MSEAPPLPGAQPAEEPIAPKAKRLAMAFLSVFGPANGKRSADQRLVLEHFRLMCGRDKPVFQVDKNGNFDPLRAAHIDGAQTQYLIIKRQLAVAQKLTAADKPKVKVKR